MEQNPAALVHARQVAANKDVINVAPALRANVLGKLSQIGAIGLDGVRGSVALLEGANELRYCFLDNGRALCHSTPPGLKPRVL